MQTSKIVNFKNWTATDFTYKYAGEEHTFEAGGVYPMDAAIAMHFAQHLAERELFASGNPKDEALPETKMKDMIGRCFPEGSIDTIVEPLQFKKIAEDIPAKEAEEDKPVSNPPQEIKVAKPTVIKKKVSKSKKTTDAEYTK